MDSSEHVDSRKARQFIQIWEVWKIHQIVEDEDIKRYFDIDGRSIDLLAKRFNLTTPSQEIYERHGVTPVLILDKIQKYEDSRINEMLTKIYTLTDATNEILKENNCYLPFENQTISSIITKELYENFLDHYSDGIFSKGPDYSFLSISLQKKLSVNHHGKSKTQFLLDQNFKHEYPNQLKDFFYDNERKSYKNESLLQLSFLDFGTGIPNTLRSSFIKEENKIIKATHQEKNIDSQILEYAFKFDSSQHKVLDRYQNAFLVPRGLFDLVSIVKRFKGLLTAKSNYGKIAYDFSSGIATDEPAICYDEKNEFFPGTLITIYLPERSLETKFDYSSIKPFDVSNYSFKKKHERYINIFDLQRRLKEKGIGKQDIYNKLFEELIKEVSKNIEDTLLYIDFKGHEIDERISKKIIYFLTTDYHVNNINNVIVINPPSRMFLQNIRDEISTLSLVDKQFKFHPTPFVYINLNLDQLDIFWLGVFSDTDVQKLNDILFQEHGLRSSDFESPDDVIGHINRYDTYGNLISIIDSDKLLAFYKAKVLESQQIEIEKLIKPNIVSEKGCVFLCNGNYYQNEYIQLFDLLLDKELLEYLAQSLYEKLKEKISNLELYKFISITSSSQKILKSLIHLNLINAENCVFLNNYFSFESEKHLPHLKALKKRPF